MLSHKKTLGFTLIEVMIVVAIIAIISVVAFPSYQKYMERSKRSEGRNALLDIAARQERNYSNNRQYTDTLGAGGLLVSDPAACTAAGTQSETCKYTLTTDANGTGNQDFDATATPSGWTDSECGALGIDETGTKTNGGTKDLAYCWGKQLKTLHH